MLQRFTRHKGAARISLGKQIDLFRFTSTADFDGVFFSTDAADMYREPKVPEHRSVCTDRVTVTHLCTGRSPESLRWLAAANRSGVVVLFDMGDLLGIAPQLVHPVSDSD